jgi:hypothetical protein
VVVSPLGRLGLLHRSDAILAQPQCQPAMFTPGDQPAIRPSSADRHAALPAPSRNQFVDCL